MSGSGRNRRPQAPARPAYVEIGFEAGIPVSLDGEELGGVALIRRMNEMAGEHGIGRIDHIENRLVGIKSREIYEAPAATVILQAHQALEAMTLVQGPAPFQGRRWPSRSPTSSTTACGSAP